MDDLLYCCGNVKYLLMHNILIIQLLYLGIHLSALWWFLLYAHKWCDFILCYCCVAGFVTVGYVGGQERLFCSHRTLYLSVLEPSVFTQIMGKCYRKCLLQDIMH